MALTLYNTLTRRKEPFQPIDASNVMFIDPARNAPTRVGVRYLPDGSKELYAKKSGARLRLLSKARPRYATKK